MTLRFAFAAALALVLAAGSAAQDRELVFGVTEGVTYQATPKEIRDKFTPLAELHRQGHGPTRQGRPRPRVQRRARRHGEAGVRPGVHPPGACGDVRDQGRTLQGGRLDVRIHGTTPFRC